MIGFIFLGMGFLLLLALVILENLDHSIRHPVNKEGKTLQDWTGPKIIYTKREGPVRDYDQATLLRGAKGVHPQQDKETLLRGMVKK